MLTAVPLLQLIGRALRRDQAVVDDHDVIGVCGLLHVVRGQEDGHVLLLLKPPHRFPDALAGLRVEAGRRLVEEEDLRRVQQGTGNVRAAALAAGELAVGTVDEIVQVRPFDHAGDRFLPGSGCFVIKPSTEHQVFADGQRLVEQTVLKHGADAVFDLPGLRAQVKPGDGRLAGIKAVERAERIDRGGLACTVRPEEGEQRALLDIEADALDGLQLAIAFFQVMYFDCFHFCFLSFPVLDRQRLTVKRHRFGSAAFRAPLRHGHEQIKIDVFLLVFNGRLLQCAARVEKAERGKHLEIIRDKLGRIVHKRAAAAVHPELAGVVVVGQADLQHRRAAAHPFRAVGQADQTHQRPNSPHPEVLGSLIRLTHQRIEVRELEILLHRQHRALEDRACLGRDPARGIFRTGALQRREIGRGVRPHGVVAEEVALGAVDLLALRAVILRENGLNAVDVAVSVEQAAGDEGQIALMLQIIAPLVLRAARIGLGQHGIFDRQQPLEHHFHRGRQPVKVIRERPRDDVGLHIRPEQLLHIVVLDAVTVNGAPAGKAAPAGMQIMLGADKFFKFIIAVLLHPGDELQRQTAGAAARSARTTGNQENFFDGGAPP